MISVAPGEYLDILFKHQYNIGPKCAKHNTATTLQAYSQKESQVRGDIGTETSVGNIGISRPIKGLLPDIPRYFNKKWHLS